MSYPTVDNSHVSEAQALLTDHYRNKIIIPALLASYTAQVQVLEGVFWDIINKFQLVNNPTGDQLNAIGSIVGAQRGALSDADYLAKVIIQIRVNRSQGLAEDILQVLTLALKGNSVPTYYDFPSNVPALTYLTTDGIKFQDLQAGGPGQFLVEAMNLPSPNVAAGLLSHTRSIGTRGILHYTTWATGNDFEFGSRYAASAGQGVWGSRYTSSIGGLLVAAAQI